MLKLCPQIKGGPLEGFTHTSRIRVNKCTADTAVHLATQSGSRQAHVSQRLHTKKSFTLLCHQEHMRTTCCHAHLSHTRTRSQKAQVIGAYYNSCRQSALQQRL